MKRRLSLLLAGILLLPGLALSEEIAVLPADQAKVEPVCQYVKQVDELSIFCTGYEVTVPIRLPVNIRVAEEGEVTQEITLHLPVGQITFYMESAFNGTYLCGGSHDPLRYPMVDWLGSPPYPGGPCLERGVLPRELLNDTQFEIVQKPVEFQVLRAADVFTLSFSGGLLRVTYSGRITIDRCGNLISADPPVTREIPFDYSQVFSADAPEYRGELELPTYDEWIGVPDAPR